MNFVSKNWKVLKALFIEHTPKRSLDQNMQNFNQSDLVVIQDKIIALDKAGRLEWEFQYFPNSNITWYKTKVNDMEIHVEYYREREKDNQPFTIHVDKFLCNYPEDNRLGRYLEEKYRYKYDEVSVKNRHEKTCKAIQILEKLEI